MDRNYYYDDRQKRRFQPVSERYNRGSDQDERYGRDDRFARDEEFDNDRSQRRFGRDNDFADRPWSASNNFNSYERYNSFDRDYRLNRADRDFGQARNLQDHDRDFDSNLGGRSLSRRNDWDNDRSASSYQSYGSNSYGPSNFSSNGQSQGTYGQSYNSNQPYSGSYQSAAMYPGQGGYGNYGSSQHYGGNFGGSSNYGNSFGSQGSSSQFSGQGSYGQNQQRWGSESSSQSSKSGRGPKGYKRSDERIKEEVCDLLTSHPEIDPSEVEIKVVNTEVTLTGSVANRQEKRLVEDLASSISGVADVTNQLRISQQDGSKSSHDGSMQSSQNSHGVSGQSSSSQSHSQGSQASKSIQ